MAMVKFIDVIVDHVVIEPRGNLLTTSYCQYGEIVFH